MMQTIAIITKRSVKEHLPFVRKLLAELKKNKKTILLDTNLAPLLKKGHGLHKGGLLKKADLAIVLGGDGTILKTARELPAKREVPILSINQGTCGFLTELAPAQTFAALKKLLNGGTFYTDKRDLLHVTHKRGKRTLTTSLALNDAVINQGGFARLIELHTEINGVHLTTFEADGLIIATPTGSTAHSLSAGGPIVHPGLDAMILTPICPLKISSRPIAVPMDRELKIRVITERRDQKHLALTIDGQEVWNLRCLDEIHIKKSELKLCLIRFQPHKYYEMLRQKLGWST